MAECDHCGETIEHEAVFTCSYCERSFCGEHRLPEKHSCIAVKASDTLGPDLINSLEEFREGDDAAVEPASDNSKPQREAASDPGDDCPRCGDPAPKGFTYCTECRNDLSGADAKRPEDYGPQTECERCTRPIPEGNEYCNRCREKVYNEKWQQGGAPTSSSTTSNAQEEKTEAKRSGVRTVRGSLGKAMAAVTLPPILLSRLLTSKYLVYAFVGALALAGGLMGLSMTGVIDAPESAPAADDGTLNTTLAEQLIHDEVNDVRRERGLSALQYHDGFATDARSHSRDMAQHDYFSHTTPEGTGIRARYGADCSTIGENIAQTYWRTNVEGEGRLTSESELADSVVDQWMNSQGHRENILRGGWTAEGIGIGTDGDEVYVTQGFCGN